jgi:hypothetical protein
MNRGSLQFTLFRLVLRTGYDLHSIAAGDRARCSLKRERAKTELA